MIRLHKLNRRAIHGRELPLPDGLIQGREILAVGIRERTLGAIVHDGEGSVVAKDHGRPRYFQLERKEVLEGRTQRLSRGRVSDMDSKRSVQSQRHSSVRPA